MGPNRSSSQKRTLRRKGIASWATASFKVSASAVMFKVKIVQTSFSNLLILRGTAKDIIGNKVTATSDILPLACREVTTSQSWNSKISTKMAAS
jgi:hypothetical protein